MHALLGKMTIVGLVLMALFFYATAATYQELVVESPHTPAYAVPAPWPLLEAAHAYAIFDVETGAILASSAGDEPFPIASVTKLPAAAATMDVLPLEATTTVTVSDVLAEGRAGKLEIYQEYSHRELLFPLLLESSNDAAAALERATDAEVVARMNELAETFGATSTSFSDASGLSARNVSTAHDIARFVSGLYKTHPHIFDISRLSQYVGEYTGWVNNSPVISDATYRGGKHGYTEAAGRTIVALFDEQFSVGKRTLGYVVLGSDDLIADVSSLRQFVSAEVRFE